VTLFPLFAVTHLDDERLERDRSQKLDELLSLAEFPAIWLIADFKRPAKNAAAHFHDLRNCQRRDYGDGTMKRSEVATWWVMNL
jgi:hypothetical protein